MITLSGKSVFNEIAFGKLSIYKRTQNKVKRTHIENIPAELERFEKARQDSIEQLKTLYEKALGEIGEANAMIFSIHQMMLDDADFTESVKNIITTQQLNAETAVAITCSNLSSMFAAMEDVYMQERAADVKDISERVISNLSSCGTTSRSFNEPVILAADDLAPSETMQLDKSKILAFVTENGSSISHTAILARTMGIPALISVSGILNPEFDGNDAIVDGSSGCIYIDPDEKTRSEMKKKKTEREEKKKLLAKFKGQKSITLDGREIKLYANIGDVSDLGSVLLNDAQGIGLFRSEFLYLQSSDYPSEDTQFEAYRKIIEGMAGKRVIIRTFDIGADKKIDYFNMPEEENPAMGFRAVRMYLKRPEIFRTQIRALLRASAYGRLAIMIPMIMSLDEVIQIKKIIQSVKNELSSEAIPFSAEAEFGIMIETPAAALISDKLAKEVDFFSVGTNDLTQYTLALDRQNEAVGALYDPSHTAVLRLLKMTVENAHKNNIWAGICGEAAADLSLTDIFLSIGVDELSVTPSMILPLRKKINETDISAIKNDNLAKLE